jgi:hypothetical protein
VVGAARAEGPQLTTRCSSRHHGITGALGVPRNLQGDGCKATAAGRRLQVSHLPPGTTQQYLSRLTQFARAMDAVTAPSGCNRGMDSFDTAYLVAAPIAGLVLVVATAIATLVAH